MTPEPPSAEFGTAPAERVEVVAAFCRGYQAVSTVNGTLPTAGGPRGAIFQRGITDVAIALLPMRSWNNRGGPADSNHPQS